jgi:hypothetical protein
MTRKILFLFALCLPFVGCLQDTPNDIPDVRYTVIISNQDESPLDSATVLLLSSEGDSIQLVTDQNGLVRFGKVSGEQNQISVSRRGYRSVDSVDQVPVQDSATGTVLRVIRFRLISVDSSATGSLPQESRLHPGYLFLLTDSTDGKPLEGVTLSVLAPGAAKPVSDTTDATGIAYSDSLAQGIVIISVSLPNYVSRTVLDTVLSTDSTAHVLPIELVPSLPSSL